MARPTNATAKELILPVFTQWERVGSITGILSELENGIFYDAALLVDQMMRDDRIRATWDVLVQSTLGCPIHFEPATNASGKATKKMQAIADHADEDWWKMVPRRELVELLKWGFFLGVGIARKTWQRVDGDWHPLLQTWHAGALRFDLMTNTYMLRTQDQGEIPIQPGDPNWVLFTPFGFKYGRLNGHVRSLAMVYLARQWAFRDRARHSERHGMPFLQLIVPAEGDQKDKDTARKAIAALGSETASVTPQGQDGNKFDWKLIEAQANSHQTFSAQIDHLDDAIAIVILGQKTSTKGANGLGSDANPGETVRRDKIRFMAQCVQDIATEGVLGDWTEYNYGAREQAPSLCIEVDPPDDGTKKATEMSLLGDAVGKLEKYGADVRKVLEEAGVPMLTPEQAASAMQDRQDMQPEPKNPPPGEEPDGDENGGGKPDGDGDE